jgi:thioredoxin-like negative regulator of GroEL
VVKVDTEKYPALASRFSVTALPTMVLFKDGKVLDRIEGLPAKSELLARLRYLLSA